MLLNSLHDPRQDPHLIQPHASPRDVFLGERVEQVAAHLFEAGLMQGT